MPTEKKIEHLTDLQRHILAVIPRGEIDLKTKRPQSIRMRNIADAVYPAQDHRPGSHIDHEIREEIAFMIRHGIDIVSSCRGFYRPTRAADPYLMATRLFRQGASLMKRARMIAGARAFDQIRKQNRLNLNRA